MGGIEVENLSVSETATNAVNVENRGLTDDWMFTISMECAAKRVESMIQSPIWSYLSRFATNAISTDTIILMAVSHKYFSAFARAFLAFSST